MTFLDTSPGGFIALANLILYSTVGVEIWMLTSGSLLAMFGTLGLIATLAGLLCAWAMRLMGPEDQPDAPVAVRAAAVASAPATTVREPRVQRALVTH